ncbi:transposase zinc-binding domain-containing protein [Salmonella enterica]|nr:transposase zinc-binding domain-containing protein [Salmonella enterica]EJC0346159.1 transposase zinc-binding domain-containing protein [Salmonella enterica]EJC0669417.1 transposase zinc-binding domain-containing protein [Salmonella enterica]
MSKACSSCGFKAMEQWVSQQSHILADCDWQHITFTMSHLLWSIFNNNWSLLNALFRVAHGLSPAGPANRAWMWVFSVRCTPTVASSTSIHIFILSDTRGGLDITYDVWRELFFKKHAWKQSGAESSSDCLPLLFPLILAARRG